MMATKYARSDDTQNWILQWPKQSKTGKFQEHYQTEDIDLSDRPRTVRLDVPKGTRTFRAELSLPFYVRRVVVYRNYTLAYICQNPEWGLREASKEEIQDSKGEEIFI